MPPHKPSSILLFNITGINNLNKEINGEVKIKLIDHTGKITSEQQLPARLPSHLRTDIPVSINLPEQAGGYVLVAELTPENGKKVISRRFLKIGESSSYQYFNLSPVTK